MRQWFLLGWVLAATSGCRCSAPADPDPVPTAQKQPAGRAEQCQTTPERYTLQGAAGANTLRAAEESEREEPFAIEVGSPLTESEHIWLPFAAGQNTAQVGVLDIAPGLQGSRRLELPGASADAGPPRLARLPQRLLLALPRAKGKTRSFQVGEIHDATATWGAEVIDQGAPDDSMAFDFAANAGAVGLAWDTWDALTHRSRIDAAFWPKADIAEDAVLRHFSSADAESPRLLAHPMGFWLTWIAREPDKPTTLDKPKAPNDEETAELASESYVVALSIAADGTPLGSELAVTPKTGFARSYDVAAGHAGQLLVVWRDEPASSGTEGGTLYLTRGGEGGFAAPARVAVRGEIAGTAPSLEFDPNPGGGAPHGWLSVESGDGKTWFAALSPDGSLLHALHGDPGMGGATLLAAQGGRLLLAEPRGKDLELRFSRCAATLPSADAGP